MYLGADESTGYKVMPKVKKKSDETEIIQEDSSEEDDDEEEDDSNSKSKKKIKETKSLHSTQLAITQLQAILPDKTTEVLWENEFANSIFGHQPLRHAEEKGIYFFDGRSP